MSKDTKPKKKFKWQGYVNVSVPSALYGDVEKLIKDEKSVFFKYNEALVNRYSFKFYFDVEREDFKCVMTCNNPDDANFGYAMSAFAGDWFQSLAVVLYKHYEICETDWQSEASSISTPFG